MYADKVKESFIMSDFNRDEASEKLLALADYLEIDPETITELDDYYHGTNDSTFSTEDGEIYVVLDESEASDAFYESVENFIDECGIDGFSEIMQDWIKDNAVDSDWFETAYKEDSEFYANDVWEEEDEKYGNRLISELYSDGVISDEDFESDEDDEPLFDECLWDQDELVAKYVESRVDNEDDYIGYFRFNFGESTFMDVIKQNNLLNIDKIADELERWDGRGPSLSYYDGVEHDLGNGYYAYRVD